MIHLGPLEQEIMDIIWTGNGMSVREVLTRLQCRRQIAYTTVMTVMNRLTDKGLLQQEVRGKCFIYSAKSSQTSTLKQLVHQTLENLIDQFGDQAVAAFIDEVDQLHSHKQSKKK